MTVDAFQRQLNRMNADAVAQQPANQLEMQQYLLNQVIEKFILLERADELKLDVTDEELDQAVADIKKDYPEGTFKTVLLEQAVSYNQWKKELKTRMLMEKVIQQELDPQITVTQDDISAYYEKHYLANEDESGESSRNETLNETLFDLVRNEKKEKAYQAWIANLQKRYQVQLNPEAWKKITQAELSR
jgi:FKBP-type peptidyl-prolyl cis-trans isomerase (trigger factor)